jgi:hypothetical protein
MKSARYKHHCETKFAIIDAVIYEHTWPVGMVLTKIQRRMPGLYPANERLARGALISATLSKRFVMTLITISLLNRELSEYTIVETSGRLY